MKGLSWKSWILTAPSFTGAFLASNSVPASRRRRFSPFSLQTTFEAVLDFEQPTSIDKIDRLDDAIMGGISTSSVQPAEGFARWVGVCRTDGGGFCGFRSNPFETPLQVGNADGFYINCRLVSDDEPERRVWKLSTRLQPDRGEQLFQAPFEIKNAFAYQWIKVPFDQFRYVRGPRMIPDGPEFDPSSGVYQLGMTMSKFQFGNNSSELENFRDGFFELQIKSMGLYNKEGKSLNGVVQPTVLGKQETKQQRSMAIKALTPVAKVFFSEQSQRRKSALRILCKQRGYSRLQAIAWGWRIRRNKFQSTFHTLSILGIDAFRTLVLAALRLTLVYPLLLLAKVARMFSSKKDTTRAT